MTSCEIQDGGDRQLENLQMLLTQADTRGVATEAYIGYIYPPKISVQVNFLWGKNVNAVIEHQC